MGKGQFGASGLGAGGSGRPQFLLGNLLSAPRSPPSHPDTAYQPPSFKLQEALLFGFTGLLSVLCVLGTALLLWKKVRTKRTPNTLC